MRHQAQTRGCLIRHGRGPPRHPRAHRQSQGARTTYRSSPLPQLQHFRDAAFANPNGSRHVFNDQHRRSVCIFVSTAHNPQRLVPEVDRVSRLPVGNDGAQCRRLCRLALDRLQPEQELSHPIFPPSRLGPDGWDRAYVSLASAATATFAGSRLADRRPGQLTVSSSDQSPRIHPSWL